MGVSCHSKNKKTNLNDLKFGQSMLTFRIVVSNIKAKNLPYGSSYVQIRVNEHIHKTNIIRFTENPHWTQQFTMDVSIEAQQLPVSQFQLQIMDDEDRSKYKLQYSLYEIASGPQHHDIMFKNKASIIFDVKMGQHLQYKIMTKSIKCCLNQQLGDVAYSFVLKVKSDLCEHRATVSPKYINPTFLLMQDEVEEPAIYKYQALIRSSSLKHISTKEALMAKKDMFWEFRVEEAPFLEFDIFADDFSNTTFILQMYVNKSFKPQEWDAVDFKLLGSTYVSFTKFCSANISTIASTETLQVQESQLKEGLYNNGDEIGVWKGQFIIKSNQFVSQISGVRTENGIVNQSALLMKKVKLINLSGNNKEIEHLINLQMNLEELTNAVHDRKTRQFESLKVEIELSLLEKPHIKLYQSEDELLHCQQLLIKLQKYLIEHCHNQNEQAKELFYSVLSQLIYREELDVAHLHIDQKQERLHVAQMYIQILIRTIPLCLCKIVQPSCSDKEREFFIKFAVLAYYRLPNFRAHIFQVHRISKEEEQFFQWVYNSNEKGQAIANELEQLQVATPVSRNFLWHFIIQWCQYSKSLTTWQNILGYEEVIQQFLQHIEPANRLFAKASCALLQNHMLLSRFLMPLYSQTKLYDATQVISTLTLLNLWLELIGQARMPSNFDYSFFFKGIFLILQGDHAICISKSIQVLYWHFHLFPDDPKKDLSEFLFGDIFFKLFMHWSPVVRNAFMHLLVYRIQHRHRSLLSGFEKVRDINKELQYAFFKTYSESNKEQLINDMIYLKYSQHMEVVKKINQKFLEFAKYRNTIQKQLQDKSLKVKLIRKKQHDQMQEFDLDNLRHSNKSDLPEIHFSQHVSQVKSTNDAQMLQIIDDSGENSHTSEVLCESFSSFLNLNEIIKEIEDEHDKKKRNTIYRSNTPKSDIRKENRAKSRIVVEMECDVSQIHSSLLKYLPSAFAEWSRVQKEYQRWIYQMKIDFKDLDAQKRALSHTVPYLEIRIPKDESNQEASQENY